MKTTALIVVWTAVALIHDWSGMGTFRHVYMAIVIPLLVIGWIWLNTGSRRHA